MPPALYLHLISLTYEINIKITKYLLYLKARGYFNCTITLPQNLIYLDVGYCFSKDIKCLPLHLKFLGLSKYCRDMRIFDNVELNVSWPLKDFMFENFTIMDLLL
jgi:hypothetical protein